MRTASDAAAHCPDSADSGADGADRAGDWEAGPLQLTDSDARKATEMARERHGSELRAHNSCLHMQTAQRRF